MQNSQYKILIYGKNVYREYIADIRKKTTVRFSTLPDADVRFDREKFFCDFDIIFTFSGNLWTMQTDNNIYCADGIIKSNSINMQHGDSAVLRYADSGAELFRVDVSIDFDCVKRNFDSVVNMDNIDEITIGGRADCNIAINDSTVGDDYVTVRKENGGYYLYDNDSRYGIYIDGQRVSSGARLEDYTFFSFAGYMFYIRGSYMYMDAVKNIRIQNLEVKFIGNDKSPLEYPKFNRSTRDNYVIPKTKIQVLPPKTKPTDSSGNLFLLIGPPIAMLILMVVIRGMMSSSGGSFVLYSACMMGVTIITSVIGYMMKRKKLKRDMETRDINYRSYIRQKEDEIIEKRRIEYIILKNTYRSQDKNIDAVMNFDKDLFDRSINDVDFMDVKVGDGERLSINPVEYKERDFNDDDDNLALMPENLAKKYETIQNAPIVAEFGQDNAVGVLGNEDEQYDMFKIMLADLVIRQFYEELRCFLIIPTEMVNRISWVRWFRHFENEQLNIRNIICDEESEAALFEYIYSVLSERAELKGAEASMLPRCVVFVFDSSSIKKHPLFKYIEHASEMGFTFVFFEQYHENLPLYCTQIVRLYDDEKQGIIYRSSASNQAVRFTYEGIDDGTMESIALRMSSIETDKVSLEGDLTKNISLFELLNIYSLNDIDIEKRWAQADIVNTMRVPLGVKIKNKIVYLDLHEKYHGPHGLVAGTTGSGKSEILQTYILSAATLYHPYEISFVIIDFKGGGMVNQFKDLPHLNGSITNIDGKEINRSLRSIKAELRKRQALFAQYGVNKIGDYIKLYKRGETDTPLPHLILIVDEFAELKMEQPEFMKELISTARIGRSLGVHLILATQKPTGVVDAQIWSNSKFKLCLKVQTKEDSQEVLKTPLAAEIVEPGRAYLQVGNNEVFELFQSAYSGAKIPNGYEKKNIVELSEVNVWGKRKQIYSNKSAVHDDNAKTQLQGIVGYIHDYCEEHDIKKLTSICLPPLSDEIYMEDIKDPETDITKGISVTLGIYDDPDNQLQQELTVDLQENNVYIIGSAQMGKTAMLQTIISNLARMYTPKEVNVYVIDCGNRALKIFENSRIVGGVALASEEEKVTNLFNMFQNEIMRRQNIFSQNMVGTYQAYIEAGFRDLPQIFLVIDNVVAFREFYSGMEGTLLSLAREGIGAGINIIATGMQTNSISYKILSNFGTRIALTCNDKSEYSNIFDRCRIEPKDVPGRALISVDKSIMEFQTALSVRGATEYERSIALKEILEARNEMYGMIKAAPIPIVPERILLSKIIKEEPQLYTKKYVIPVGMSYSDINYVYIDLNNAGLVTFAGRARSGRTNLAKVILGTIKEKIFENLAAAYIVDTSKEALGQFGDEGFVEKYTSDSMDACTIVEEIYSELNDRRGNAADMSKSEKAKFLDECPMILLVIEDIDALNYISKDAETLKQFNEITEELYEYKACVILSNVENALPSVSGPSILRKNVREKKYAFMMDDIGNMKLFETSIQLQRKFPKPILLGDGYLYKNGGYDRIKTVLYDEME